MTAGYTLAAIGTALKLALAACLAADGDSTGALIVALCSPSLFLFAADARRPHGLAV